MEESRRTGSRIAAHWHWMWRSRARERASTINFDAPVAVLPPLSFARSRTHADSDSSATCPHSPPHIPGSRLALLPSRKVATPASLSPLLVV